MNFLEAMTAAKSGKFVQRDCWKSGGDRVSYDLGNDLLWASNNHPWQHYHPMCNDIFAEDWSIV